MSPLRRTYRDCILHFLQIILQHVGPSSHFMFLMPLLKFKENVINRKCHLLENVLNPDTKKKKP